MTPLAHEIAVNFILTVENDIVPSNRAHVGQETWINPLGFEVPKAKHLIDLQDLTEDNGCFDQDQAARSAHLLLEIATVGLPPHTVVYLTS